MKHVRRASLIDRAHLANMAMTAHREANEAGEPDRDAAFALVDLILDRGAAWVSEAGALGAHVIASPLAPSHRIALEVFWRVERGAAEETLRLFTSWARQNAHEARVSSEAAGRLANVVGRKMRLEGYAYQGAVYRRRF